MGLFKKKPDPISERAKALNDQIAALESEIRRLAAEEAKALPSPLPAATSTPTPVPAPQAPPTAPQPRLRSTARPRGLHIPAAATPPASLEPIFKEVDQQQAPEEAEPAPEFGTRRFDLAACWQRVKSHFRGPATSNPKLVSYLAAGSIQGLRPLRYEKRVARNRFIVLVVVLALALWGIVWIIMRNR